MTPPAAPTSAPAAIHLALLINTLSIGCLMMVMPLAADFVRQLGMQAEFSGYLSGGATLAAALSGLAAAPWLDRFNRKHALLVLLTVRFALLLACAFADSISQLTLLFVLSGCAAGPLGAVLMAGMLDLIPPEQRGRKLAYVAMGFSLAAIIAVPVALELAMRLGWQSPFALFGGIGLLAALASIWLFPSLPPQPAGGRGSVRQLLGLRLCQLALLVLCVQMFGHSLLIPHFSTFFQFNLNFPRASIGTLFFCGGLASLVSMRVTGVYIDKGQAAGAVLLTSLALAAVTLFGFAAPLDWSLYLIFTLFMALSSARTSSSLIVMSAIPAPHQRAAFMSFQSTVTNIASSIASIGSARYLVSDVDGSLQGFNHLAWANIACVLAACCGVLLVLQGLAARHQAAPHNNEPRSGQAEQGSQ
ncbi:Predicted arabinose efflux permease, MFS family [Halopseudomonas sabulinigri]|uniref:Predicted arabinose efflux permease, MFS family n=1 Tax=Halopseudomonas sabulinigri TaxID=472181 RepID=A0A1H1UHB2_9GAMM|nr:MFS transporter [Halopseudomonas sabulinigri]SDS71818.1 Predicted arabinose efflux permease, MFS family [Halopseudomonas sabulinigri]